MRLRTDAAGCSASIAQSCRDRNIAYFMTARENTQITAAIAAARTDPDRWQPAVGGPPARRARSRARRARPGQRAHRRGRPQRLAGAHTVDRATRAGPPRRAAHLVRLAQLALLGIPHRRPGRPRTPRRRHASPRPSGRHHREAQELRARQDAVSRLGRQRSLDSFVRHQPRTREAVPSPAPQRRARKPSTQTAPLAALAHTGTRRAHRTTHHRTPA